MIKNIVPQGIHICCRDKNRIRMRMGSLIGALSGVGNYHLLNACCRLNIEECLMTVFRSSSSSDRRSFLKLENRNLCDNKNNRQIFNPVWA